MTENYDLILVGNDKIHEIIEIDENCETEEILQRKIVKIYLKKKPHHIFIEKWSYENMIDSVIKRRHDLVFLDTSEFPPQFNIIEVKNEYAPPENPFHLLWEAKEREKLWNIMGVNNTKPFSILYAPSFLLQNSLLSSYCAVLSYLRKSCKNREYSMVDVRVQNLNNQDIWRIIEAEEIENMSFTDLKKELRKRRCKPGRSREDLVRQLKEFQNDFKKRVEIELLGIDIDILNQEWSIENGIGSIRLFNYENYVCLIISPPNIPEITKKLVLASNGKGGREYWLWDLKENTHKEILNLSDEELEKNFDVRDSVNKRNIGLYIVDLSEEVSKYDDNLFEVEFYLSEFVKSWKLLSKMPM